MKKTLTLAATFTLLSGLANATYKWDNKICFNVKIDSVEYLKHRITENEPFDENIRLTDGNTCLLIKAGRQLSSNNVTWVHDNLTAQGIDWVESNMAHTQDSDTFYPNGLNFAVNLNLNIILNKKIYNCNNIYLGQGSYKGSLGNTFDDWWMFTNSNKQNNTILCEFDNGTRAKSITYYPTKHGSYKFYFEE